LILSGQEIKINLGRQIEICPFREEQLNPNSYNLRLGDTLLVYDTNTLDMKRENKAHEIHIPQDGYLLEPGRLYLGQTLEYTKTDGFVPMLEGRSSVGRLGLFVHVSAGFGDVGFSGFWTLELSCVQPVRVYPGVEICQIFYHTIQGDYETYEGGKYQNNTGVQASQMWREFRENNG
jgi:dCTP deaminase